MTRYTHQVNLYRHETKLARKREARIAARAWVGLWILTMAAYAAHTLLAVQP